MKRFRLPAVVLLVAATSASLAWTAGRAAPVPPTVAVVDVMTVFMRLAERETRMAELETRKQALQKSLDELEARIKSEKANYDILPDGPEKKTKREQLERLAIQFEIDGRFAQRKLDDLEFGMVQSLYIKITDSAARLAKVDGHTIVVATDQGALMPQGNVSELRQFIALKRTLYVDSRHDISEDLIRFMNNEFAAPAAANPAAAPRR